MNKGSTSTKKPRVKRKLEFSASDYKLKKKVRLKSDVIISISSVDVKSLPRDKQIPQEEVCCAVFLPQLFSDGMIILEVFAAITLEHLLG